MNEQCAIKGCGRVGRIGDTIRYEKVYDEHGKRISLPMCPRCIAQLPVRRKK